MARVMSLQSFTKTLIKKEGFNTKDVPPYQISAHLG